MPQISMAVLHINPAKPCFLRQHTRSATTAILQRQTAYLCNAGYDLIVFCFSFCMYDYIYCISTGTIRTTSVCHFRSNITSYIAKTGTNGPKSIDVARLSMFFNVIRRRRTSRMPSVCNSPRVIVTVSRVAPMMLAMSW